MLEVRKFIARVEDKDLARSNLYLVVFPSLSSFTEKEEVESGFSIGSILKKANSANSLFKSFKKNGVKGIANGDSIESLSNLLGMSSGYDIQKNLGMMAKSVSLPGSTFEIDVDKSRRKPHHIIKSKTNDSVSMTFYLTQDHPERKAMMAWFKYIYDSDTSQVEFHNNYARNIEIFTYGRDDERATVTTLKNAFPSRISSVQLGYENNNAISEFEVDFVFEKYQYTDVNNASNEGGGFFDKLSKGVKKSKRTSSSIIGGARNLGIF